MRQNDSMEWSHAGAPISQVLNDADSTQYAAEPQPNAAAPFSGKLIDLLLETPSDLTHERRRQGDPLEDSQRSTESTIITLPQPAQPSSRAARRPRIPPLLQGLHQPPPLPPNGRLFPPITDGVSGFEREIRDRVQSGNIAHDSQNKQNQEVFFPSNGEPNSPHRVCGHQVGNDRMDKSNATSSVSNGVRRNSGGPNPKINKAAAPRQAGKKRRKWSEEETRDLLLGVSRFGIGSWKKILLCPDFKFAGRSAVDLKDKFRVCCPDEGVKARKMKRRKGDEDESARSPVPAARSPDDAEAFGTQAAHSTSSATKTPFAEGAGNMHKMDRTELAKLGIQTPFAKSTRRPRHAFSAVDDENLLKGFQRYGATWLSIRDDQELGFETRRPTDLRDRFRIRYSEAYAKAGLKCKIKPPKKISEAQKENQETQEPPPETELNTSYPVDPRALRDDHPKAPERIAEALPPQRLSTMRPPVHTSSYHNDHPAFLDDHPADADGSLSPIVLSRNILHWADANTSSISSSNAPYIANPPPRDISANPPFSSNDGLHINPMVTLKLPMLTLSDHVSYHPNPNHTINHSTESSNTNMTWSSSSTSSFPRAQPPHADSALLRTPNLPTIVFPHVPAISARTTVHNLPTPADLLSGLEVDGGEGAAVGEYAGGFGGAAGDGLDMR